MGKLTHHLAARRGGLGQLRAQESIAPAPHGSPCCLRAFLLSRRAGQGFCPGEDKEAKPGIWKQTDTHVKQALLLFMTVLGTQKLAACLLHPSPLAPTLPSPKLPHHSRFVARAQGTPVPSRAVGSCPVGGQMSASCSDLSPGPAPTSRFVSGALTVSVTAPIPLFSLG